MQNFLNKFNAKSPGVAIGSMAMFLGVMIGLAWVGTSGQNVRSRPLSPDVSARLLGSDQAGMMDMIQALESQVKQLREQSTTYEESLSQKSGEAKVLNDSLQELKVQAGLTPLVGPGITVTLKDSQRDDLPPDAGIIHDYDLLRTVNELWASGAEGIAIGDQRLVAGSSIRCVGSVVRVNNVFKSVPVRIFAIGDPQTLYDALMMKGGLVEEIREVDPGMIAVEKAKEIKIPAYEGATSKRVSKVPDPEVTD